MKPQNSMYINLREIPEHIWRGQNSKVKNNTIDTSIALFIHGSKSTF